MAIIDSRDPVGASPIQSILFVKLMEIHEIHQKGFFNTTSLPGHLLQLHLSGGAFHECNGRAYELRRGSLIWYHENEWVKVRVLEVPWMFYTVNFIAPTLPPPSFENRLAQVTVSHLEPFFKKLYSAWQKDLKDQNVRHFEVHSALLQLLARLPMSGEKTLSTDPQARLWWQLETQFRQNLQQPLDLEILSKWAHRSPITIARSCQYAVGMPPMRRIKEVRLSLARALVQTSDLTLSQIAERVGYSRIHEFSRDYRKWYGKSPSKERTAI